MNDLLIRLRDKGNTGRRSNPATYIGMLEPIRKAFAKANDVKPAQFSAKSEGACPDCKGLGPDLHRSRRHNTYWV